MLKRISGLWSEYKWAAFMLALVACYAWGRHDGYVIAEASSLREDAIVDKVVDAAQAGAANEIAKLEIKHVTIQQRLERETREVPVYRDCKHSADGLLQLNAALENRPVTADGGQLPGNPRPASGR